MLQQLLFYISNSIPFTPPLASTLRTDTSHVSSHVITQLNITLAVVILQVSRPSKYHPDWGVLLGPTTPDPTVNTSMLSIHSGSGNGSPLANGGGEAPRKPSNPNRLYISGLPYNWRTQHVSY